MALDTKTQLGGVKAIHPNLDAPEKTIVNCCFSPVSSYSVFLTSITNLYCVLAVILHINPYLM